jgi:hypothetical protein
VAAVIVVLSRRSPVDAENVNDASTVPVRQVANAKAGV